MLIVFVYILLSCIEFCISLSRLVLCH